MTSSDQPPGDETGDVIVERRGQVGVLTLNRPQAINAITLPMVRELAHALHELETERDIRTIVLRGAGARGFSAGGDMVTASLGAQAGDPASARFFTEEYALNARIAGASTPVVALMDGIVLGGGVGLTGHASHRWVTERARVGMPEVAIGFVPDVGGTWLLSRAPGELGTYAGLTGNHLTAADAILLGLADRLIDSASMDAMVARLAAGEPADDVALAGVVPPADAAPLAADRHWIDTCFAADDVITIVERLRAHPSERAHAAADVIATRSPLALVVTLRALRRARTLATLEDCLALEHSTVMQFLVTPDLHEGVRAALIDKDRNPQWRPATLAEVDPAVVDAFFRRFDER